MTTLKLARLPDRTPVKLTIAVSPALHQDLCDYAAMYRDLYGETEPVADLVPGMLAAFLASDRAFTRRSKGHRP